MLELFGGKVSLTEILNLELPILNQLHDAKIRLLEDIAEKREKASSK